MNDLRNSSGLDGPLHWASAGAVTVDETAAGSPGRMVITAAGPLASDPVDLDGASNVYAFAHHQPGTVVVVRYETAGGAVVGDVALPRLQNPAGAPRRGVPSTFAFSKGTTAAPGGATRYRLVTQGAGTHRLLKPYASRTLNACRWSPGPHSNPDLIIPVWPEDLPHVLEVEAPRTATRVEYTTDSDIPSTRRVVNLPRTRFSGVMSLDLLERDILEQFFLEGGEPFLFVNPVTDELCRARWLADGEPSDSGAGRNRRTSIGLLLEVL